MPTDFSQQTLSELVQPFLNDDPNDLTFCAVKTGKHNRSFWVQGKEERYVLRIAPPDETGFLFYERLMMRQEPSLHNLILKRTGLPVAAIVGHDFSRQQINRDYMLMRALPGTPLSEVRGLPSSHLERALAQVGEYLRQLHDLTAQDCLGVHAYGYLGEHHPMLPQPDWASAFHLMWNLLLDDVVNCGAYKPAEGDFMRRLYDQYAHHFKHPVEPRLLHMDIWSQNILVDPMGNVTAIVDFDRALWGDVEIEFAVLDYCGISEPSFWQGYGSLRDTSPPAEIRRLFYLLYEIQKYMPIEVWRRNDPAGAARYREQCLSMAAQLNQTL